MASREQGDCRLREINDRSIPLHGERKIIAPTRISGPPEGSPSIHLDALRGFAAFGVLLNHWRDAFFADYGTLSHPHLLTAAAYLFCGLGHQWVLVFFVLSGYLVGGSVVRSVQADRWSWRSYLLARFTRLYMVLIPALLLGGMLDWTGMHLAGSEALYQGNSGMHSLTVPVQTTLTLSAFAGNLLFLQTIHFSWPGHFATPTFGSNTPLWSLCNEFWYYIAFPPLVFLFAKSRSWRMRVVCGILLMVWGWFVGKAIVLLGIPWLMGVAIVYLPSLRVTRPWMRTATILTAFSLFGGGLVLSRQLATIYAQLTLSLAVAILLWVTLSFSTGSLPSLYARGANRAARSSYTLYLVHMPMLVFLKALCRLPRETPDLHLCLIGAGLLFGILLYAQAVYLIFERNTDSVRKWLKRYGTGTSHA